MTEPSRSKVYALLSCVTVSLQCRELFSPINDAFITGLMLFSPHSHSKAKNLPSYLPPSPTVGVFSGTQNISGRRKLKRLKRLFIIPARLHGHFGKVLDSEKETSDANKALQAIGAKARLSLNADVGAIKT